MDAGFGGVRVWGKIWVSGMSKGRHTCLVVKGIFPTPLHEGMRDLGRGKRGGGVALVVRGVVHCVDERG